MKTQNEFQKALQEAFYLGENHWRLSDSENYRDYPKAEVIFNKFQALKEQWATPESDIPERDISEDEK